MYFFGFYHWHRHLPALAEIVVTIVLLVGGLYLGGIPGLVLIVVAASLLLHAIQNLRLLFKPHPWRVDRMRFEFLANLVPLGTADSVLDIGCGTGRSLVGLIPHVAGETTVIGTDVFTDDVILGNSPRLARRNAETAGKAVEIVKSDATHLPFQSASVEVITISQVLHDLPETEATAILEQARACCRPDGYLAMIELPLVADDRSVTPAYWTDQVTAAGFTVETFEQIPWKAEQSKAVIVARPA